MGATSTRQAFEVLVNTETVLALELLCAAQGIDFRRQALGPDAQMGQGTRVAYEAVRAVVPFIEHDEMLAPRIEGLRRLVVGGQLVASMRGVIAVD